MIISGSASCSCSPDGLGSSLTEQTAFLVYFFFYTGLMVAGTGWFSGSAAAPAAKVRGAPVLVTRVGIDREAAGLFSDPETSSLRALDSVEQGSVGVGLAPARCRDLRLSGVVRLTTYFF